MTGIFASVIPTTGVTVVTYLICSAAALACGIIAAACAAYKTEVTKSFTVSLILLPVIVETVIIMVNGNIGTGVAVMGAFSLVRFRSVPGKARDIVSIFLAMTAGLACASGYVGIALLFTAIVCLVMLVLAHIRFADEKQSDLRIMIPETLNYSTVFDEVFKKYTKYFKLIRVKTCNMGSMYKLYYRVQLKNADDTKEFIDDLRLRNGNLEINLCTVTERNEEL